MNAIRTIMLLITCVAGTGTRLLQGQATYRLVEGNTEIRVTGTSTIHDWEMEIEDPFGQVIFSMNDNSPSGIESVNLVIGSDRITSGNDLMDAKTRKALKAGEFPQISFSLEEVTGFSADKGQITGSLRGTLFVAGKSKIISLPFSGTYSGDEVTVTGRKSLSMSDFNIEPPTAMLGALKTGDTVGIMFHTTWKRPDQTSAYLKE